MSTIVSTAFGELRGAQHDGVTAFLGVPYAAPLTAANRLRPAQPVQPWTGVKRSGVLTATTVMFSADGRRHVPRSNPTYWR